MKRNAEFFLGRTLPGGYQLRKSLGEGGFGIAFEAYTGKSTTPVAVKVYNRSADPLAVATFAEEAIRLAQLKHPHIVPFIRFGVQPLQLRDVRGQEITEYYPFFVMKYANKGDVRGLKPKESFTPMLPEQVIDIISQAASGVQFAHDAETPYIHRDLKPENLLRYQHPDTGYIDVWVADFGIAIVAHTLGSLEPQGSVGTPPYMAPEQFRGRAIRESDQYALGIIAYELLTGRRPFEGEQIDPNANDNERFFQWESIQRNEIPLSFSQKLQKSGMQHFMNGVLEALEPAVRQALEKEPAQRFSNVHHFAETLKETHIKAAEEENKRRRMFEAIALEKQKQAEWEAALRDFSMKDKHYLEIRSNEQAANDDKRLALLEAYVAAADLHPYIGSHPVVKEIEVADALLSEELRQNKFEAFDAIAPMYIAAVREGIRQSPAQKIKIPFSEYSDFRGKRDHYLEIRNNNQATSDDKTEALLETFIAAAAQLHPYIGSHPVVKEIEVADALLSRELHEDKFEAFDAVAPIYIAAVDQAIEPEQPVQFPAAAASQPTSESIATQPPPIPSITPPRPLEAAAKKGGEFWRFLRHITNLN